MLPSLFGAPAERLRKPIDTAMYGHLVEEGAFHDRLSVAQPATCSAETGDWWLLPPLFSERTHWLIKYEYGSESILYILR